MISGNWLRTGLNANHKGGSLLHYKFHNYFFLGQNSEKATYKEFFDIWHSFFQKNIWFDSPPI